MRICCSTLPTAEDQRGSARRVLLGRCRRPHGLSRILDPGQLAPSTELDDMDLDNPFDLLGLLQVGGLPFRAGSAPLHMPIPNTPLGPLTNMKVCGATI
jgi:hypothetical protein